MLHELHIFGPLPAAVLQEALRGLAAEPFCDVSGRFDRFRSRPPHGVQDRQPDGVQNLQRDGAQNWNPDGVQDRRRDGVQNRQPDGVQSWRPDGAQDRRPDGVQNVQLDGAQSWRPDGAQDRRPDGAQNWNPDGAQDWRRDSVQSWQIHGLCGAEDRRRLLGALLVPVREARATALLRVVGSEIRGAAFDLEGTLTELEFVNALAERLGFGARMQARTHASMTGRTSDFVRDYEQRMAALRGVDVAVMEEVIGSMTLAAGVEALCAKLHANGIPVAVISGGCSRLGEAVRAKIALRALYATVWEERDARFTGRAASPVVDPESKRRALEDFARTITRPTAGSLETVARTITRPLETVDPMTANPLETVDPMTARPLETVARTTTNPLGTVDPMTARPLEDRTHTTACPLGTVARTTANPLETVARTTAGPLETVDPMTTGTLETVDPMTAGTLETADPMTARSLEDRTHTPACPLASIAAAGDGANDLEMLSAAGTALLTHATSLPPWPEILAAIL